MVINVRKNVSTKREKFYLNLFGFFFDKTMKALNLIVKKKEKREKKTVFTYSLPSNERPQTLIIKGVIHEWYYKNVLMKRHFLMYNYLKSNRRI